MKITKRRGIAACILALVTCVCMAVGITVASGAESTDGYKYLLAFQDNFNGTIEEAWPHIVGGSSYSYAADGSTVRGWRFGGENHIAYKTNTTTDYGKFLYGDSTSTDYVFEVKVKADVPEENLQQYLDDNKTNIGAGLTLNTHLPFFVTDPSPDTNTHTFRGRSVCFSNYAIGFFEYSESGSGRWAQSVRIANAGFDANEFSWREWHTIRVEATAEYCSLWLDGVLLFTTPQSSFIQSPETSGPCGFAGICADAYSTLHFDDFRYWTSNPDYDDTITEPLDVTAIDAADFADASKVEYQSSSFAGNITVDEENNRVIYNDEPGTDIRLLNEHSYGDFSMTVALDMDNQLAAKGNSDKSDSTTANMRTSNVSGIHFWSSSVSPFNGYLLSYMAVWTTAPDDKTGIVTNSNTVNLNLIPYVNGTMYHKLTTTPYKALGIGTVQGTTSVVLDLVADSDAQTLQVTAYKSMEDKESGTAALTKTVDLSLTGCTYSEGHIGMRVNAGGTLNLIYEAQYLAFSAQTQVPPPDAQPVKEAATQTVSVTAGENGHVLYGGTEAESSFAVATHSDVALEFAPAEGYIVDDVTINGQSLGALRSFTLQNVTEAYAVEVSFTDAKELDVYILAGQSNAAGFTPVAGLYKGYTYGGTVDEEKLAEYENGYTDVLYYGVTQSADPATAGARLQFVHAGQGHAGTRLGPELGFAEAMSDYYGGENGKAAVLKYAVGATSLGNFQNSTSDEFGTWMSPSMIEEYGEESLCLNAGLLYENLLVTVRMGLQAMIEAGYEPAIRGVMWMQGEADSTREDLANLYQKHLSALITDLRGDLTGIMTELKIAQDCSATPFVIGKIGADLQNAAYEDVVREQMQKTAASMTAVRCAETEDLLVPDPNDNNDVWHFSAKGILAVGNRFAEMLAQETGKKAQVTYEVSFDPAGGEFEEGSDVDGATQSVKQWLTAAEPDEPVRVGYTFLGWFAAGAEEPFDFAGRSVYEDVALTAHWQPVAYEITYHLNDGAFAGEVKTSYTVEEEFDLPVPGRSGYVFDGWFANEACEGDSVTAVARGTTGALEYWARWTETVVNYTVSAEQPQNGAIILSQSGSLPAGTEITVTATPAAGYVLEQILVNGAPVEGGGNTFFLEKDTTVSATFVLDTAVYTVTLIEPVHGSARLSAASAQAGTEITVTARPDDGYVLDQILVNGEAIDGNSFRLFENSEVAVTFKLNVAEYTVTVETPEHGAAAASVASAPENTVVTITATPDEGYELVAIRVNGQEIEGNTFVLSQNSTVTVEFGPAQPAAGGGGGCRSSVSGAGTALAIAALLAGAALVALRRRKG